MEWSAIGIFAIALALAAGSPGPSIAALVSRVLSSGLSSVMPFLAAMWVGEAMWFTLAVFGLAAVAETFHWAAIVLRYAGIAYLIWLACKMWRQPVNTEEAQIPKAGDNWRMFAAGTAITLGNPKIMLFYLALLPSLIDLNTITWHAWVQLLTVLFAVLIFVDFAWAFTAASVRSFLQTPRMRALTNKISASLMAGAAGFLAFRN